MPAVAEAPEHVDAPEGHGCVRFRNDRASPPLPRGQTLADESRLRRSRSISSGSVRAKAVMLGWAYATGAGTWRLLMAGGALVTGATGFVGGRLVSALVQAGWEVRGMVRDCAGSWARQLERAGVALHEGTSYARRACGGPGRVGTLLTN